MRLCCCATGCATRRPGTFRRNSTTMGLSASSTTSSSTSASTDFRMWRCHRIGSSRLASRRAHSCARRARRKCCRTHPLTWTVTVSLAQRTMPSPRSMISPTLAGSRAGSGTVPSRRHAVLQAAPCAMTRSAATRRRGACSHPCATRPSSPTPNVASSACVLARVRPPLSRTLATMAPYPPRLHPHALVPCLPHPARGCVRAVYVSTLRNKSSHQLKECLKFPEAYMPPAGAPVSTRSELLAQRRVQRETDEKHARNGFLTSCGYEPDGSVR